jgi:hypothetical protein
MSSLKISVTRISGRNSSANAPFYSRLQSAANADGRSRSTNCMSWPNLSDIQVSVGCLEGQIGDKLPVNDHSNIVVEKIRHGCSRDPQYLRRSVTDSSLPEDCIQESCVEYNS